MNGPSEAILGADGLTIMGRQMEDCRIVEENMVFEEWNGLRSFNTLRGFSCGCCEGGGQQTLSHTAM